MPVDREARIGYDLTNCGRDGRRLCRWIGKLGLVMI